MNQSILQQKISGTYERNLAIVTLYMHGWSQAGIAKALAISRQAVWAILHRKK